MRRPGLDSEELNLPKFNLREFPFEEEFTFHATHQNHWLKELLLSLSSSAEIKIHLEVKKLDDHELGDPFLVKGHFSGEYQADCIRCLEPIPSSIEASFCACFLDKSFEKKEEYADQLTIYADCQECDLYFSEKQVVDIQEFINEVLQLNHDHYPLHSEDCRGLCQHCGNNLNVETCQCPQSAH
jgi:uncharacterized protein